MSQRMNKPVMVVLLLGVMLCSGCGFMSAKQVKVIDVDAEYLDLENRSVAVVVSTSDYTAFNHPRAAPLITNEITRRIQTNVPGVTMSDPEGILAWQKENEYWSTRPPSQLIRQLKVDRLILIEIGEYRTHEPGDKHVMRGVITASVHVVEAEAADPDNFGASYNRNIMFPEAGKSVIGKVGGSEAELELLTQMRFCEEVAGLFFDHQIVR